MGSLHLSPEQLSAFADGECSADEGRSVNEHLFVCVECRSSFEAIKALDAELLRAPQVTCAAALPLISASLDGELGEAEVAVAERHVETCGSCRAAQLAWSSIPTALASLPSGSPSASVDRAIAELTRRERRPSARPAFAARGLVALTAVLTILIAALSRGAAPLPALAPSDDTVLVAAAQEVVLNTTTNTLYVLDTVGAAVDARDAATSVLKARIEVGGRPTALALNASTNTVLVLDASQKRVTEIDGTSNTVVGFASVAVDGTPTSISVEPTGGRIIVTSTTVTGAPASASTTTSGSFVVLDATTKKVETVHDVAIAPQTMVFDATGGRAALVSTKGTTLLDENYKVVGNLPGGVAAAFAQGSDRVAVLTQTADGSLVVYGGRGAPASLHLAGSPRAITALPGGGFLVLVQVGSKSRVSYVAPDGTSGGDVDLGIAGKALAYDAATDRFTVVGGENVVSSSVPQVTTVASPSPGSPAPSSTRPSPSQSPSSSASPSPSPSGTGSPSASPTATPIVAAKPTPNNGLEQAQGVSADLIRFALSGGRLPLLVSKSGERLWVLDDANQIETIDMTSGDVFVPVRLPASAQISQLKAGRAYVYALDASAGVLYVVNVRQERATPYEVRLLKAVTSAVVGLDDRLWMGVRSAPYLLAFDPKSGEVTSFDLGPARISALAIDSLGRLFYADDSRSTAGTFDPKTLLLNEVPLGPHGATTSLVVDGSSTLWLGTSTGEIFTVRGGRSSLAVSLHRPITTLSFDQIGRVWYLAPLPAGAFGFGFAALDGTQAGISVNGPVASIDFSALGRAWLADPRGGFYVSREGLR